MSVYEGLSQYNDLLLAMSVVTVFPCAGLNDLCRAGLGYVR